MTNLSAETFKSDGGSGGATIPTLMNNIDYNNRSAGVALAAKYGGPDRAAGQVVFVQPSGSSSSGKRSFILSNRQQDAGSSTSSIRSGLNSIVNVTTLSDKDSLWEGGRYHIIDGLLTPPDTCKKTIRGVGLASLDNALNRTGMWDALDGTANLTCLGPSNDAFKAAGSPDVNANETVLSDAIKFHTLPEVAYSDFLVDGQTFKTLGNLSVKVTIQGSGANRQIWFNNAKVLNANVL